MAHLDDKIDEALKRFSEMPAEERQRRLLKSLRETKALTPDPFAPRPVWGAAEIIRDMESERHAAAMETEREKLEAASKRAKSLKKWRRPSNFGDSLRERESRRDSLPGDFTVSGWAEKLVGAA